MPSFAWATEYPNPSCIILIPGEPHFPDRLFPLCELLFKGDGIMSGKLEICGLQAPDADWLVSNYNYKHPTFCCRINSQTSWNVDEISFLWIPPSFPTSPQFIKDFGNKWSQNDWEHHRPDFSLLCQCKAGVIWSKSMELPSYSCKNCKMRSDFQPRTVSLWKDNPSGTGAFEQVPKNNFKSKQNPLPKFTSRSMWMTWKWKGEVLYRVFCQVA